MNESAGMLLIVSCALRVMKEVRPYVAESHPRRGDIIVDGLPAINKVSVVSSQSGRDRGNFSNGR